MLTMPAMLTMLTVLAMPTRDIGTDGHDLQAMSFFFMRSASQVNLIIYILGRPVSISRPNTGRLLPGRVQRTPYAMLSICLRLSYFFAIRYFVHRIRRVPGDFLYPVSSCVFDLEKAFRCVWSRSHPGSALPFFRRSAFSR